MFVALYMLCSNQNNIETQNEKPLPLFLILFFCLEFLRYYGPSSKSGDFRIKNKVIQWNEDY